jgi:hypothetical protein
MFFFFSSRDERLFTFRTTYLPTLYKDRIIFLFYESTLVIMLGKTFVVAASQDICSL